MKTIVVLGGGMMGSTIARDLARDDGLKVKVYDASEKAVAKLSDLGIDASLKDLSKVDIVKEVIHEADVVVGALPGFLGYQTINAVIEAGKDFADICFLAEDPTDLSDKAKEAGVTVVFDCGVAPGMSNMFCGHAVATFDEVDSLAIYVGGLPKVRRWPFEYKAPFSPIDVLEEYTRPARIVENGKVVVREALSEPETMDFAGIGSLVAFNTDGLRTLVSLPVPNMVEKTLRYPGHIELMKVFRECGFFDYAERTLKNGTKLRPIDLTTELLFPMWEFEPGEEDLTVFRFEAVGTKDGKSTTLAFNMLDRYDPVLGLTSMARTTAFPCAIMARKLAYGEYVNPGVHPPETLGKSGFLETFLHELESRGVFYKKTLNVGLEHA